MRRRISLGSGQAAFRAAAGALRRWDLHRGAGLRVCAETPAPAVGLRMSSSLGLGPVRIRLPCAVVWLDDQPRRYGFGYGTLPGHPECGEEAFEVYLDDADEVWLEIRAFSRPARWYTRLAGPLASLAQDFATGRYLAAMRRIASGGHQGSR